MPEVQNATVGQVSEKTRGTPIPLISIRTYLRSKRRKLTPTEEAEVFERVARYIRRKRNELLYISSDYYEILRQLSDRARTLRALVKKVKP